MTEQRYLGCFEVMREQLGMGFAVVLTGQPLGTVDTICTVSRSILDTSDKAESLARWIAAALNAYNQQEQETKT